MTKFPKILYVKLEIIDGQKCHFASTDILDHAVMGEKIDIGVYHLADTQVAEGIVKVTDK